MDGRSGITITRESLKTVDSGGLSSDLLKLSPWVEPGIIWGPSRSRKLSWWFWLALFKHSYSREGVPLLLAQPCGLNLQYCTDQVWWNYRVLCNCSTWKAESGGSEAQGHLMLHSGLEAGPLKNERRKEERKKEGRKQRRKRERIGIERGKSIDLICNHMHFNSWQKNKSKKFPTN